MEDIYKILKKYWNFDDFRPLQKEIIESVLSGNDTLGLMPTGGGKSLTFQIPAMTFDVGVTIVITPLISLMKDQVDNLKKIGIGASYLHAGLKPYEVKKIWEKVNNSKSRLLYIAPERLENEFFLQNLRNLQINLIVVDEAHCISQWGYDFRPSYLKIKKLRDLKPDVPVLALTATATPAVCEDIMNLLRFKKKNIFKKSFVRDNLSYIVRHTENKLKEILHILSNTKGSTIIYVRSRKKSRQLSDFLNSSGLSAIFYHAGLLHEQKEERQNDWKTGKTRIMVATNAFGMGIDKADVRVVIHLDLPPSLEEYYQEAGRAGRDGKNSYAVLLVAKRDKAVLRRHLTEDFPERDVIKKIYEKICIFLHLSVGEGYDKVKQFDIFKFISVFKVSEKICRSSLRLLGQAGYINFIEDPENKSRVRMTVDRNELYKPGQFTPTTEKVLEATLRLYPGLFSDFVHISEDEVINFTRLDLNSVYESYLELNRKKILSYIPKSSIPVIHFPTSREDRENVKIGKDIYEKRKEAQSARIESIIDYAFNDSSCRVKRMLNYFGEEKEAECLKCDLCREAAKVSKKRKTDKQLIQEIFNQLKTSRQGLTYLQLSNNFKNEQDRLHNIINYLQNENFIIFNGVYYTVVTNN